MKTALHSIRAHVLQSQRIGKVITRRVKKSITRKRFVVFLIACGIFWLLLPRIPGILKLLSFIEKDFIDSTSEYMYESTQTHPELHVRVGRKDDPQGFHVALFKEGASISFTGVAFKPGQQMIAPQPSPTETSLNATSAAEQLKNLPLTDSPQPSPTPIEVQTNATSDLATTSTASAIEPQAITTILSATPAAAFDNPATPSALPQAIDTIQQSFFGTYEKLILQAAVYPTITYHWEGSRLIETWNITSQNAEFSFAISESGLTIAGKDTQFFIFKDSTPIIELTSIIQDAHGAEAPVIQKISNGILSLTVAPEWISSPERAYPLTLRRSYQALANNQVDPKTVLTTKIPTELVATAVEIPTHAEFFTVFQNEIIFVDTQNRIVYSLTDGVLTAHAILPERPLALSCSRQMCNAATSDGIYSITLTNGEAREPLMIALEEKVTSPITPLGGYAQTEEHTYITQNTNPGGTVRSIQQSSNSFTTILDNLSYAQNITITPDESLIGVWANGQLYIARGTEPFVAIRLPAPPIAMSAGSDGFIYSIITLDDGIMGIVRSTSTSSELLSGLHGTFTGLVWKDNQLSVAYTFNQYTGYLLHIPLETAHWEAL